MKKYNVNGRLVTIEDLFDSQYMGTEYGLYFEEYEFEVPLSNENIYEYFELPEDTDLEEATNIYQRNFEEVDRHFTQLALEDL